MTNSPWVQTYDLYLFAPDEKVIAGWHRFEADDDETAVEIAEGLAQQAPLELWQADKLVRRWDTIS